MLFLQFRMEMYLVVGKRNATILINDVTSIPVSLGRSNGKTSRDDHHVKRTGDNPQFSQYGFPVIKEGKIAIERNNGIPEFRQHHAVTTESGGSSQVVENPFDIAPGVAVLKFELYKSDS